MQINKYSNSVLDSFYILSKSITVYEYLLICIVSPSPSSLKREFMLDSPISNLVENLFS